MRLRLAVLAEGALSVMKAVIRPIVPVFRSNLSHSGQELNLTD